MKKLLPIVFATFALVACGGGGGGGEITDDATGVWRGQLTVGAESFNASMEVSQNDGAILAKFYPTSATCVPYVVIKGRTFGGDISLLLYGDPQITVSAHFEGNEMTGNFTVSSSACGNIQGTLKVKR